MQQIYWLIKLNRLFKNHRIKFAAGLVAHALNLRHLALRFDPVMDCNLRCRMCAFSNQEYRRYNSGIFTGNEVLRIAEIFLPKTLQFYIGCRAEPTLYKGFPELVKLGKERGVPYVGFATNGQLLTIEHIEKFIAYRLDELSFSSHGVKTETYESLMINASYKKFHEALSLLDSLKAKHHSAFPSLRFNYTVNPDNLEELAGFFEVYGKYDIRTLQIRPMMDVGGVYQNKDLTPVIGRYNEIIKFLGETCRQRRISFLVNTIDPTYKGDSYGGVILIAVYRDVLPGKVWREDFDWKNETYDEFCNRIGWKRYLLKCIFASRDEIIRQSRFERVLSYDVKL